VVALPGLEDGADDAILAVLLRAEVRYRVPAMSAVAFARRAEVGKLEAGLGF
jgi:hypothetical protein